MVQNNLKLDNIKLDGQSNTSTSRGMPQKNKPLAPDIKRLLADKNITESHAEQRLAERGMQMMHAYLELVVVRLQSAAPPADDPTDAELHALVHELQHSVRADVPVRV